MRLGTRLVVSGYMSSGVCHRYDLFLFQQETEVFLPGSEDGVPQEKAWTVVHLGLVEFPVLYGSFLGVGTYGVCPNSELDNPVIQGTLC